MDEQVYAITNLNGYLNEIRQSAAQSLSEQVIEDNLDDYISIGQMTNLVKHHCLGYDSETRIMLNESSNEKIFEETAIWIHNIGLAKLAGKDLIECAWDNESNQMVFWPKKKEKKSNANRKKSRRKDMGDQK